MVGFLVGYGGIFQPALVGINAQKSRSWMERLLASVARLINPTTWADRH